MQAQVFFSSKKVISKHLELSCKKTQNHMSTPEFNLQQLNYIAHYLKLSHMYCIMDT